jgi:hypothetical protein
LSGKIDRHSFCFGYCHNIYCITKHERHSHNGNVFCAIYNTNFMTVSF